MSDLSLAVQDLTGVIRNIFAADPIAVTAMKGTTRKSGKRAYRIAQQLCPVDEGFMKDNMELVFTDEDLFWELGWEERVFTEAGLPFYPPYQEYGTDRNQAQPSITPAHFEESPRFQKEIGDDVRAALERRKIP